MEEPGGLEVGNEGTGGGDLGGEEGEEIAAKI